MAEDGKIVYKVGIDDSSVESEASKAGNKAGNALANAGNKSGALEEVMIGAARRIGEAFVNMGAQAAGAVKSFVEDSINVGATFERSMDQVAATLGISADDIANNVDGAADKMAALEAKAKEMGASTNFTATQAAEGLNILAMSGYSAADSIAMIEDVLHLAAAGSMEMSSAAGYISGAMKGFNDETKDSAYYADLMAKGATLANTSVTQLGDALSQSAATASSYGQSAESTTTALLRLAEQGETGSNAATMLAAAMKNIYSPTDQAKQAMEELGVKAYDPVTGKARDFNTVINELNAALSDYSAEERTAVTDTIFGIQGFQAYNKMVVTSTEKQNEWNEALAKSSGEAAKQYATMTDNLQGDMDILNSSMDSLKLAIFEELQPSLRGMAQFGSQAFTDMAQAMEQDGIPGVLEVISNLISQLVGSMMEKAPELLETGLTLLESAITGMAESADEMADTGTSLLLTLVNVLLAHLPTLLTAGITLLVALITGILNNLPKLLETATKLIGTLIQGLFGAAPQLLAAALQLITTILNAFAKTDWLAVGKNIVDGIWNGIQALWGTLTSNVTKAFNDLVGGIMSFLGISSPSKKFKYMFEMVDEGAIEGLEAGEDELVRTTRRVFEQIPDTATGAMEWGGMRDSLERNVSYNLSATGGTSQIIVPLSIDGREIARATAWNMGEQLAWEEMG